MSMDKTPVDKSSILTRRCGFFRPLALSIKIMANGCGTGSMAFSYILRIFPTHDPESPEDIPVPVGIHSPVIGVRTLRCTRIKGFRLKVIMVVG